MEITVKKLFRYAGKEHEVGDVVEMNDAHGKLFIAINKAELAQAEAEEVKAESTKKVTKDGKSKPKSDYFRRDMKADS